ncbi:MAG: YraN family protein [Caldilineales bacterium]|nr:YraN family protein [Caldilineales bacterium]MDW8317451.1 YraN family protein [Anaerolineae bacterium]
MTDPRRSLGAVGERLAAEYLAQQGYRVVARNWRSGRGGEIDLVAEDGACLVIVEVRTRRGERFGPPEESVTAAKQARLAALAEAYAQAVGWAGPLRVDVVAVHLAADGRLLGIRHLRDAVGGRR